MSHEFYLDEDFYLDGTFYQDGHKYNIYDLPQGFIVKGNISFSYRHLYKLPNMSNIIILDLIEIIQR